MEVKSSGKEVSARDQEARGSWGSCTMCQTSLSFNLPSGGGCELPVVPLPGTLRAPWSLVLGCPPHPPDLHTGPVKQERGLYHLQFAGREVMRPA